MDISGTWEGHYFNNWITGEFVPMDESSKWAFAIRLTITQDGDQISGSMTDLRPTYEISCQEQHDLFKLRMTWLQRIQSRIMIGLMPKLIIKSELRVTSNVQGCVEEGKVTFTKVYEGQISTTYFSPPKAGTTQKADLLAIQYAGALGENGTLMAGDFQILDTNVENKYGKGQFLLRRIS